MTPKARLAELQASVEARAKRYFERDLANYAEAVEGGRELVLIRSLIAEHEKYGAWGQWLDSVFPKSRSTAYEWIFIAEGQEDLSSAGQVPESISEASTLIKQLRAKGDDEPAAEAPALPAAILRQHDVVLLGRHVLICGDASVMKVGMGLAGKGRPRLLVTDPPYGIQIDAWDVQSDWREVWDRYPGDAGYVFFEATLADEVLAGLKAAGFKIVDDMVWRKTWGHKVGSLLHRHEMIYLVTFGGKPFPWAKDRPPLDSVLRCRLPAKERKAAGGHLTPKPVELMKTLIEAASDVGDVVIDPFCGAGSTLLAAEQATRICLAIEREPAHCDIIVRRWQTATKRQALLWQGGRHDPIPFSELRHDDGERHQPLVRMLNRRPPSDEPPENPLTPESLPGVSITWDEPPTE